jgi:RNA polymerase-binding transcription factor DksA
MNTTHLKHRLEEEKTLLEKELAKVGRKNPHVPGEYETVPSERGSESDLVDQSDVIKSFEENDGVLRDLEARYGQVLAALARFKNDCYGKCSVCGEMIETDRLEADPAAQTCKAHLNN